MFSSEGSFFLNHICDSLYENFTPGGIGCLNVINSDLELNGFVPVISSVCNNCHVSAKRELIHPRVLPNYEICINRKVGIGCYAENGSECFQSLRSSMLAAISICGS